jgi:hypothetical protein
MAAIDSISNETWQVKISLRTPFRIAVLFRLVSGKTARSWEAHSQCGPRLVFLVFQIVERVGVSRSAASPGAWQHEECFVCTNRRRFGRTANYRREGS